MKNLIKLISVVLLIALAMTAFASCAAKSDVYVIEITVKDYGKIKCELDRRNAPITVDNFVSLVKDGFYDGLTFHRIKDNFMIQGGCPKGDGTGDGPREIFGEFLANGYTGNNIYHERGVISMARGNGYNTGSCQFFITNADARASLDGQYAAFGYVISGMNVVDAITKDKAPLGEAGSYTIKDKSLQPVIESIVVVAEYNI